MSNSGLFTRIYRDIVNDQVSLIRLPDLMIRLRKVLSRHNMTFDMLARVIQTDVGASAYLLNIANSPAYKTRVKANDIQSAIRIIGVSNFSNLVTAYAVRSLVKSNHTATMNFLKVHWQRSAYRAAIAHAIAKLTDQVDADKALLAGLLQDVGAIPILMKLQDDQLKSLTDEEINDALENYSSKVGIVLAKKWELDEELASVIRNAKNLSYDGGDKTDLVDVVIIAKLLSQISDRETKWPRMEETPCLRKFGTEGLTIETSFSLLKQAREDIHQVRRALAG